MARRKNKPNRRRRKSSRRRAIYVLPNLITSAGLFCGFYSIVAAVNSSFQLAAGAVLLALLFDFLDGKVARATGSVSRFGVEYDSLADLVAFGVAPAVLMHQWALFSFDRLGLLAAFLYVTCGALRLARFNIQVEKVGTKHFVGLPIPAAASMIATTVLLVSLLGHQGPADHWSLVGLVFLLSFLMVSPVRYLSFKEVDITRLKSFNGLVAAVLFFTLVAIQPKVMGFAIIASYVLGGPLAQHYMTKRRAAQEPQRPVQERVTSA